MKQSKSFDRSFKRSQQQSSLSCVKPIGLLVLVLLGGWLLFLFYKVFSIRQDQRLMDHVPNNYMVPPATMKKQLPTTHSEQHLRIDPTVVLPPPEDKIGVDRKEDKEGDSTTELDESYHIVFSTGCSEFQDWQSIGMYSSAIAVGQRGIITRIASGCNAEQEEAIRHAMSHLPANCRVHFAPNTQVRDHKGHIYKYANKPLGLMHWLINADPPIPPSATVALCDPDFFFLRPLYHDSFDEPTKYFASGKSKSTPMPDRIVKGTMVAQRYGIGGAPWRKGPGKNGQKGMYILHIYIIYCLPITLQWV